MSEDVSGPERDLNRKLGRPPIVRRWGRWGLALLALCLCVGLLLQVLPRSPGVAGIRSIPGLTTHKDDTVDGVDAIVGPDGALHVAWKRAPDGLSEDNQGNPGRRVEVWYCRGERLGETWGQPARLVAQGGDSPRLVQVGVELHLLYGNRLQHLASSDGGRTWIRLPPIISPDQHGPLAFDAVSSGGGLVVAYVALPTPDPPVEGDQSPLRLFCKRWSPGAPGAPVVIADVPDGFLAWPRLISDRAGIHLIYTLSTHREIQPATPGGPTMLTQTAQVFYAASTDGGAAWSARQLLSAASDSAAGGVTVKGVSWIAGIEIVSRGATLLAIVDTPHGRVGNTIDHGRIEGGPVIHDGSRYLSVDPKRRLSAADNGKETIVAWIDERYKRYDPFWLPWLFGIPWSDSPGWANNDIEILRLPRGSRLGGTRHPLRVTGDLSYASSVRTCATGSDLIVLWSGRARVGHTLQSFGATPEVFFARFHGK